MNNIRLQPMTIYLVTLCMPVLCPAAELFSSQQQKDAFLKALSRQDERYDPAGKMIRRPFSSPGYHTTLKGGYIHPTRDSLNYAVALLDSARPGSLERAEHILRRVISLQNQDPKSRTYGIWSWFAEEPLDKMSPPDWNWADFCGAQLLQVAVDHMERLPADLQRQVRESINPKHKDIILSEAKDLDTSLITAKLSRPGRPHMSLAVPAKPLKSSPKKPPLLLHSASPIPGNHVKPGTICNNLSTQVYPLTNNTLHRTSPVPNELICNLT